jgi:hypothetical protein
VTGLSVEAFTLLDRSASADRDHADLQGEATIESLNFSPVIAGE